MKSRSRQGIETHPGRGVKWGTDMELEEEREMAKAKESV